MIGLSVFDDVLPDPVRYRDRMLRSRFGSFTDGDATFHGMAECPVRDLPDWVQQETGLVTVLNLLRLSPEGQREPHYVHADTMMGDWTGVFYLHPHPPEGDGTSFWLNANGQVRGVWGAEMTDWRQWAHVPARFNRLVIFPADFYHSRGLEANYGHGDDARLIQVLFGSEG